MKTLEFDQMETIEGGGILGLMGSGSATSCAGAALGIIGFGIGIALTPVTGGLSTLAVTYALTGAFSTGLSLADCL